MKALRIIAITIYAAFSAKYLYAVVEGVRYEICRRTELFASPMISKSLFVFILIFFGVVTLLRVGFIVFSMIFSLQKNFSVKKSTILLIWLFVDTLIFHLSPAAAMTSITNYLINWGGLQGRTMLILLFNSIEGMATIFIFVVLLFTALRGRKEMIYKGVSA